MQEEDAELSLRRSYYRLMHVKPLQDGVEARDSNIPGAGLGLFTTRKYAKNAEVCEYTGIVYANQDAWKLSDKTYLMKLGDGKYVDALHSKDVLARYINDSRGRRGGFNVRFEKRPRDDKAVVLALRDLEAGEELYVDYGQLYWLAYNFMHPSCPVRGI